MKKATKRFKNHEKSSGHLEAVQRLLSQKETPINAQLVDQAARDQHQRRCMFLKQIATLRVILRQGLAIRGHIEEESNLFQLLTLRCDDDPNLRSWINQKKYSSPEIINECIALLGQNVVKQIVRKVKDVKYFSILADETRDVSNTEQLSVCIR